MMANVSGKQHRADKGFWVDHDEIKRREQVELRIFLWVCLAALLAVVSIVLGFGVVS